MTTHITHRRAVHEANLARQRAQREVAAQTTTFANAVAAARAAGVPMTVLAEDTGLSRQQLYNLTGVEALTTSLEDN